MTLKPSPLAFIIFLLAGRISRQQRIVIDCLKAENRMLPERLERSVSIDWAQGNGTSAPARPKVEVIVVSAP